jgi:hypothetical protein
MELNIRSILSRLMISLTKSKIIVVISTLQFAASINLITTLVFNSTSFYIKSGIILCSVYFIISSWFLIIFDNHLTFIERVSIQNNDNYDKYLKRINGKVGVLSFSFLLGFVYTIYSLIIIITLIL